MPRPTTVTLVTQLRAHLDAAAALHRQLVPQVRRIVAARTDWGRQYTFGLDDFEVEASGAICCRARSTAHADTTLYFTIPAPHGLPRRPAAR